MERFARWYDLRVATRSHGPEDPHYPAPAAVLRLVRRVDARMGCASTSATPRAGAGPRLLDLHAKDPRDPADKGT